MNPVVAALLVGALTTFGKWARGKNLDMDTVIGVVVLAVCLALIDQMNPKLARAFSLLAVIAVAVAHAEVIFKAVSSSSPNTNGGGGGGLQPDFH